jgi:hypothetical protein
MSEALAMFRSGFADRVDAVSGRRTPMRSIFPK